MNIDVFWVALLLLVPIAVFLSGHELIVRPFGRTEPLKDTGDSDDEHDNEAEDASSGLLSRDLCPRWFRRIFLQVYLLVMASEWLQVWRPF